MDTFQRTSHSIHLGAKGRLVLPAPVRKQLELEEGDRLVLTIEADGRLSVVSFKEQARKCRGLLREAAPGRSLADELIAERRVEAARE
jgi:AbrB family looped-hinge helix DNA binding protein